MSKELEALENIRTLFIGSPIDLSRQLDIVETALKDYERLLKLRKTAEWADEKLQTKNKLKALEIIKRKGVNVNYLKYHFEKGNGGYREYKRVTNTPYLDYYPSAEMLTKEEFDLLKEVFL